MEVACASIIASAHRDPKKWPPSGLGFNDARTPKLLIALYYLVGSINKI
jgi:hypothetical protein